jgi:hypothetical protein
LPTVLKIAELNWQRFFPAVLDRFQQHTERIRKSLDPSFSSWRSLDHRDAQFFQVG